MAIRKPKVNDAPRELTPEERLITDLGNLRAAIQAHEATESHRQWAEMKSRYDKLRRTLRDIYRAGLATGRNAPMSAPGWLVTWTAKSMPAMDARIDHVLHIHRTTGPVP